MSHLRHVGDQNFQKSIAPTLRQYILHGYLEKFRFTEWGQFIKCPNFFKFPMLNIFVMFEDRASCIIADIWELIFYLSEKCIFNDLELQFQGQIALCLTWHYLYSIMVAQNFPKSVATALGQYMPQYHLKKISLRLNGGIFTKNGGFLLIFKAQYLRYLS